MKVYRRKSIRLKWYDYSQNGAYFITICTKHRECLFGKIVDGKMVLNEMGKIAHECWQKIEQLHVGISIGEFVIMPNHVHGIILIDYPVGFCHWQKPTKKMQLPPKGISSFINHYKGSVKKWANKNQYEYFSWQRNYYEHIIRNEESFQKISDYILANPQNWENDKRYS